MKSEIDSIDAQLKFINWRNTEFAAITTQLETSFPRLIQAIDNYVEGLSGLKVPIAHARLKKMADEMVREWAVIELQTAKHRAQSSLEEMLSSIPDEPEIAEQLKAGLFFAAGPALTAASFLALPSVLTFATVTTTSFFVFSTSSISFPLLALGGGVLVAANLASWTVFGKLNTQARIKLRQRLVNYASKTVFGLGMLSDAPYLVNEMQAAILKSGQHELKEAL